MGQFTVGRRLPWSIVVLLLVGCARAEDPVISDILDDGGGADAVQIVADARPDTAPDGPVYSGLCSNRDKDPGETDFDCGGNCPKCALGQGCIAKTDCAKGDCVALICTAISTCSDGKRDGKETDLDCGGPDCAACPAGKKCSSVNDCVSAACAAGVCG